MKNCIPWYLGRENARGERTIFCHDENGNSGYVVLIADKEAKEEDLHLIITAVNAWKAEDK